MTFRDEMMDYKEELKLVLQLSGTGRYLTSELSNIWMNPKVFKHRLQQVGCNGKRR